MLASNSEREAVVQRLRDGHVRGLLGADTYEQRIDATLRATRRAQLHALISDLPSARQTLRDALVATVGRRADLDALEVVLPGWTDPQISPTWQRQTLWR